jgi:hypothetical protein
METDKTVQVCVVMSSSTISNWGTMRIAEQNDCFVVKVTIEELDTLGNALNESLECIEEWEYQARMGVSREDARFLLSKLSNAYKTEFGGEGKGMPHDFL